jgi:hypothetical protein
LERIVNAKFIAQFKVDKADAYTRNFWMYTGVIIEMPETAIHKTFCDVRKQLDFAVVISPEVNLKQYYL